MGIWVIFNAKWRFLFQFRFQNVMQQCAIKCGSFFQEGFFLFELCWGIISLEVRYKLSSLTEQYSAMRLALFNRVHFLSHICLYYLQRRITIYSCSDLKAPTIPELGRRSFGELLIWSLISWSEFSFWGHDTMCDSSCLIEGWGSSLLEFVEVIIWVIWVFDCIFVYLGFCFVLEVGSCCTD